MIVARGREGPFVSRLIVIRYNQNDAVFVIVVVIVMCEYQMWNIWCLGMF